MLAMRNARPRLWMVGLAIVALLIFLFLVSPIVLGGRTPSLFTLILLAASVLGAGLVLRWRGGAEARMAGLIVAVIGLVALVIVAALLVAVLNGLGRPF
jgi:hypothetical protein